MEGKIYSLVSNLAERAKLKRRQNVATFALVILSQRK